MPTGTLSISNAPFSAVSATRPGPDHEHHGTVHGGAAGGKRDGAPARSPSPGTVDMCIPDNATDNCRHGDKVPKLLVETAWIITFLPTRMCLHPRGETTDVRKVPRRTLNGLGGEDRERRRSGMKSRKP